MRTKRHRKFGHLFCCENNREEFSHLFILVRLIKIAKINEMQNIDQLLNHHPSHRTLPIVCCVRRSFLHFFIVFRNEEKKYDSLIFS